MQPEAASEGVGGGQEEEVEQRHGYHLHHQQEQQVRRRLRQEHHASGPWARAGCPPGSPAPSRARTSGSRPSSDVNTMSAHRRPPRHLQHVGRLRRLRERRAVHDEHEQRVDAHGREHLLRAELLLQVLAQEASCTAANVEGFFSATPPAVRTVAPFSARHLTPPPCPRSSGTGARELVEIELVLCAERHHAPARQHERMRAHVEALAAGRGSP